VRARVRVAVATIVVALCVPAAVAAAQTVPNATTTVPTTTTSTSTTTTTISPAQLYDQQQASASRSDVSGEIDALRASDAQVRARLALVSAQLTAKQADLATAKNAAAQASAAYDAATAALASARSEATRTQHEVRDMAVDAFVNPPGDEIASVLLSNSLEDASRRKSMLDLRARERSDLLDRRRAALAQLTEAEQSAQQTKDAADATQQQQQAAVDQLSAAQQQQQSFANALEDRLDNSLSEADGLDSLDPSMANQLDAQAGSLSAAAAAAGITPIGGPDMGAISYTPNVQIVNVGGFNVNVAIAPQIAALLTAFSTTGHKLGGGAYRSAQQQIALRIAHCGSDPYSIYQKPSSQCSPPTAPPGRSMHEVGLAIDFECDGALISNHSNFCFMWLAVNGAKFGLQNLPSEPWHWSTNGN
jgi:hypothetical protein